MFKFKEVRGNEILHPIFRYACIPLAYGGMYYHKDYLFTANYFTFAKN